MPDLPAVKALQQARASAHEAVTIALRRAGYDPRELDALPEPGECDCSLATAIRRWHEVNAALDAAQRRSSGWRF